MFEDQWNGGGRQQLWSFKEHDGNNTAVTWSEPCLCPDVAGMDSGNPGDPAQNQARVGDGC